jgi:hypothetical protein
MSNIQVLLTLDEMFPDQASRPHADNPALRLAYLEQVLKHIMLLGRTSRKTERMRESAEEALGWMNPFETRFALEE